jgi:two-component system NtrC family sensor kinase
VGTGLGLSICRRIVTSMGGEIWFHSEPGRGTDFFVSLRVAEGRGQGEEKRLTSVPAARRGRVLVIDDDEMVSDTTAHILAGDHDVVISSRAGDALRAVEGGEPFDVILCDLMMPQMTGMYFFAALTKLNPVAARTVVFMTGGAFTAHASAFLAATRNRYLEKPFDLAKLRALVNEMVR